ncbi:Delta3,5-Delta2,4-dienoyl-CoA isomerase, mitochondrial [Hondaea fermentalgiana]|uniref:Delta3,5-Delta2,4-dienoyl-CoA isomerase, mitochondrial n=1 Tax=Hondaea fermentalgiana TaxID=2315210 RepID=A0A2R5G4N7_9STRA|nr:Delta3,5-Delta2,4-dienoyl-CoA isomerase, mitochondrial [Hondaea fermentalgiana]|eukprot:GBG25986.1 Delta3,5-Delta2,4-dienoyl-CoA isomerase, mitochondrial [Hondaea fermentalgiana]
MLGTYASSLCARTVARGTARSAQRLGLPRRGLHAAASGNSDVDILQEWAGLKPATSGLTRQGAVDLEIGTQGVATVTLQRPEKLNAFNMQMFRDLELAFDEIESRRQERARELAYTGRFVSGPEAERIGLVLECLEDAESLQTRADELAREIASKSPITVRGIKANMNYSRDHTVDEGLEYVLRWNGAHLLSADLQQAAVQAAKRTKNKKKPE